MNMVVTGEAAINNPDGTGVDLIITIGGDGTLLQAVGYALRGNIPLLGINAGNVGFLTDLEADDLSLLSQLKTGEYRLEHRMLLDVAIREQESETPLHPVLNDVVLMRGSMAAQTIFVDVFADSFPMGQYQADGVIVSTPTGSTGYNMSAGGPLLEPESSGIVINPICPHSLLSRAHVLSENREVVLRNRKTKERPAFFSLDGGAMTPLLQGQDLVIRKSSKDLIILKIRDLSPFDILLKKLL
jgi:NAD+ kinase